MALTRGFKETIRARVKRDPGFRKALTEPSAQRSAPITPNVSAQPLPSWIPRSSPPSFSPTSTVSPPLMRSISSSAISSGNSLASASPAVTPSVLPPAPNSSSPANAPWPDNEQATIRKALTKRCSLASSLAFAKGVANLPQAVTSNRLPPGSPAWKTRSALHRGPVVAGLQTRAFQCRRSWHGQRAGPGENGNRASHCAQKLSKVELPQTMNYGTLPSRFLNVVDNLPNPRAQMVRRDGRWDAISSQEFFPRVAA